VAVTSGLLGQALLVFKRRAAFWVWIVSNGALIALNASLHLWWLVAMYAVYSALCVLSLWTWKARASRDPTDWIVLPAPGLRQRRR
jgi:membrane protein implicated in regulation of membrane protease activity